MGNRRKLMLYIATSLDGYIAKENDSLEWLFKVEGEGDNGYSKFYETVDTILMGRRTYDWIMKHEHGEFPYKNKESYVFSRQLIKGNKYIKVVNEDIIRFTNKLKNEEGKNIWIVGGSDLIHSFVKEKLVDEFIIQIAPTLIGKGIPLFNELECDVDLHLKGILQFNQIVQLHYEIR